MFWVVNVVITVDILSFLVRLSAGICSTPCFTMTPSNPLRVVEGDSLDIRWEYWSENDRSSSQWKKYDGNGDVQDLIAEQHGEREVTYTVKYRHKVEIVDKVSLRLKKVKASDSGWYGCELKFNGVADVLKNRTQVVVADSSAASQGSHGRHYYWIFVGVVFLLIIFVIIYIYLQRRKQKKFKNMMRDSHKATNGKVMINMDDLDGYHDDTGADAYQVIPPLAINPDAREWECPRETIVVVKVIGKGAFGLVAKGIVAIGEKRENTVVALKMLKKDSTEEDKTDFLAELELMKTLDYHPNVISLYGCVTVEEPYLMIIEYVPFGDLLGHLRKSRGLKDTYFDDPDIKPTSSLTSQQLFSYASQIANGMVYLSSRKVLHRDLAARNVLVSEGEVCKITDFGLARDVHQENIYTRTSRGRLPVKWTAYESLLYGTCTTMSDVWSFGILLYEIFTIGGSPYPKVEGKDLVSLLQEGYRMPRPKHVKEELYKLMMNCWQEKPESRPSFHVLRQSLKKMSSAHNTYVIMEDYDSKLYENLDDLRL